jgi:hypothetical protein
MCNVSYHLPGQAAPEKRHMEKSAYFAIKQGPTHALRLTACPVGPISRLRKAWAGRVRGRRSHPFGDQFFLRRNFCSNRVARRWGQRMSTCFARRNFVRPAFGLSWPDMSLC